MMKTDLTIYRTDDNKYELSIFFQDGEMVSFNIDTERVKQLQKQGIEIIEIPF